MRRFGTLWIAGSLLAALAPPIRAADEKPKDPATKASASEDGFAIQSEDGAFRLRVTGLRPGRRPLLRGRRETSSARTRSSCGACAPSCRGRSGRSSTSTSRRTSAAALTVLQDAYLDARYSENARLRVGKFKSPFGLERLHSATGMFFVERAFPTSIAPNRDVGVQLHGELGGGVAAYAVGVFNGVVDGGSVDTDTNDGKDVVGRLFLQPFRKSKAKAAEGIGIGIAASTGRQEGPLLPVFRSPGQVPIFTYAVGVAAGGTRTRVSPQASYGIGPFRLIGEYARSSQDVTKGTETSARDERRLAGRGDLRPDRRDARPRRSLAEEPLREGQELGRLRARRALLGAGRGRRRVCPRSRRSRPLGEQGKGRRLRPQLVPHEKRQVRRQLRADHVRGRERGRRPRDRERRCSSAPRWVSKWRT